VEQKSINGWSKTSIILSLLNHAGFAINKRHVKEYLNSWWCNPRNESKSFRLTESGLAAFTRANITPYVIELPDELKYTNRLILQLDNFITGPYYLERKRITVFDENMAIQLMLFAGDLKKYADAKVNSKNYN
jgi:hypothetical protein